MKIICVENNYLSDPLEAIDGVGSKSVVEENEPEFFIKPDSAMLRNNDPFYIPNFTKEVGFETEVVVKISRLVKSLEERFAYRCYDEIGLGIDFTALDLLRKAKSCQKPWERARSFDRSAAISPCFIKLSELGGEIQNLNFDMELNGEVRQSSNTANMLFTVDRIISHISQFVTLKIGDLIFTGTPVGGGTVEIGDRVKARLEGQMLLDFDIK